MSKYFSKLLSLVLALVMILGTAVMIHVGAESAEETLAPDETEVLSDDGITEAVADHGEIVAVGDSPVEETSDTLPTEAAAALPTEAFAPDYPVITGFENLANGVKITWDSFGENNLYRVYYRKAAVSGGTWEEKYGAGGWRRIATVKENSFVFTGVQNEEVGIYTVRCLDDTGSRFVSGFNAEGWENRYYAAPSFDSVGNTADGVSLSWTRAQDAQSYCVYRKETGYWQRMTVTDAASFVDTTAESGKTFAYTLRMITDDGKSFMSYVNGGKTITYIAVPEINSFENLSGGVRIRWAPVPGAALYRIYEQYGNSWKRLSTQTQTEYTDTAVKDGQTKVYTVRCLQQNGSFASEFNHEGWAYTFYASPVIRSLTNTTEGVELTWDRPDGAEDYRVYRRTEGAGWKMLTQTDGDTFTDETAVSGVSYTYTIRMISADGKRFMSYVNGGRTITFIAAPKIRSVSNLENGAKVTWEPIPGAELYRLYYRNGDSWTRLTTQTQTEYLDTSVRDGQVREYTVRCLHPNGSFASDFYRDGTVNTFYACPVIRSLSGTEDGVQIDWDRAEGAEDYRVYRRTEGTGWKLLTQTDDRSFVDESAVKGQKYTYTLRMITADSAAFMSYCNTGKSITYCETPAFSSMTNGDNGVLLSWNAVKGASRYRVYVSNGTGWTRLTELTGTSYTDTAAKDGDIRIYTVRCFDEYGNFGSDFKRDGRAHTYYAPPAITVRYQDGAYTVSWDKRDDNPNYRVYRRTLGGAWGRIATVDGTEYTDSTVGDGEIYSYTLRYVDGDDHLVSSFLSTNPYYLNGSPLKGSVRFGNDTYLFTDDGKPVSGYRRESGKLHYYQNGKLVRKTVAGTASEGYYYADNDGLCYEGEDMRLAADFLMRYGTGSTLEERMKTAYLYLAHQCPYQRRYTAPKVGSDMAEMAIDMYKNHNGDCYRFAGAFAYIAKLAGYRVRVTLGETDAAHVDHGWTEVYVNGKWLYCDSQAEIPQFNYPDYTMYMKEKHPWNVHSHRSTELTLQNGKAVWK